MIIGIIGAMLGIRTAAVGLGTALVLLVGCSAPGDEPEALCLAGFEEFIDGDVGRAALLFERAVELEPGYVGANYGLALSVEALGTPHRALEHLDRAIAREPDFALAYYVRGIVHAEIGSEHRAAVDTETAARLDPALDDGVRGQVSVLDGGGPALCARR